MSCQTPELVAELLERLMRLSNTGHSFDGDAAPTDPKQEALLLAAEAVTRQPQNAREVALQLVARREAGELLGHLLGKVTFLGCEVLTGINCVVPRKETEILGRAAIATLGAISGSHQLRVVDMCCGAGNLACAIANHVQTAQVWATDLMESCCNLATTNAARLGLTDRVKVYQGDLFGALSDLGLEDSIDLICCNPPYISTARLTTDRAKLLAREPREAFDGGPYGLSLHQRVLRDAAPFLRPGGWLMFEFGVGQDHQFELLVNRMRGTYQMLHWENDEQDRPRVAAVQRAKQGS